MASRRTGRSVLSTTTCSWATRIIRSSTTDPRLANFLNNRISQDVDMVTFRVNYRFGGYGAGYGGPGVGRY